MRIELRITCDDDALSSFRDLSMTFYKVIVLRDGYSKTENGQYKANGTSTLVVGPKYSVIVDTLSPWDRDDLLSALNDEGVSPSEITHVVNTHTHPDHCGNNNLFTGENVLHIIGCTVHCKDVYFLEPNLEEGEELCIDGEDLKVIPTAGHTLDSVSLLVRTESGIVVVAGDTFEKQEDLSDDSIWLEAGSQDEQRQRENRARILELADYIVPGHGPMFKVNE